MKKLTSILLTLAMLVTMIPLTAIFASAADTAIPTTSWTDNGNYDLSWCDAGADDANSVQVDGAWYKVLGYAAGKVYEIKDAADLAGLSVLTNAAKATRTNPLFANCTFYVTSDLDLTGKLWTPIAKQFANGNNYLGKSTVVFGGNLIGSKGDAVNGNGGVVTIKGMTVNVVAEENDADRGQAAGLIGVQGGGSVKNLTLTGATITTDTKFAAGSFVGRQWGPVASSTPETDRDARCMTVYENLTSDAVIVKTTDTSQIMSAAGGIVGVVNDGQYKTEFKNCTFTGSITNASANTGGIIGYSESGSGAALYLDNCVVTASTIKTTTAKTPDVKGIGGLIGGTKANIYATNCYVSSNIENEATVAINAGGFIGQLIGLGGALTISLTDCHFDGTLGSKTFDYNGAFLGLVSDFGVKVTFKNCLNTGVITNSKITMMIGGMAWIGTVNAPNDKPGNAYTFTNTFSAVKAPYFNNIVGENIEKVTINGTTPADAAAMKAVYPTVVGINDVKGDLAKTKMVAMFGTGTKWVTRNDMYPTLAIASALADTKYATADYTWFDSAKGGSKAEETELTTQAQLLALARIAEACGGKITLAEFIDTYYITVANALLANVDALFSAEDAATVKGVATEEPADTNDTTTTEPSDTGAKDTTSDDKGTEAPVDSAKTTENAATDAGDDKKDGGCGSFVGGGAIALVSALGCALVIGKKRKEQ